MAFVFIFGFELDVDFDFAFVVSFGFDLDFTLPMLARLASAPEVAGLALAPDARARLRYAERNLLRTPR